MAGSIDDAERALSVDVFDEGELVASASTPVQGNGPHDIELALADPHLWSPADPHLYDLGISYGEDAVGSYCAFRSFTIEHVEGKSMPVFCCNHEPLFLKGVLDQGYWSDGLLTAPSDEALRYDIEVARSLGFNMLRKHLKVEPARWYYHCDCLGMIVWQDVVNGGAQSYPAFWTSQLPTVFPGIARHVDDTKELARFGAEDTSARELWLEEARATIEHLRFFPCIASWTVFNEAWGQFEANKMTDALAQLDDTRPLTKQAVGTTKAVGITSASTTTSVTCVCPRAMDAMTSVRALYRSSAAARCASKDIARSSDHTATTITRMRKNSPLPSSMNSTRPTYLKPRAFPVTSTRSLRMSRRKSTDSSPMTGAS